MQDWSRPHTIRQWLKRLFGLQAIVCGLLVILLAVSELRFDWIEEAVGAYLATTNDQRPEIGAIWEKGRQATTARQALEQIVTDRQANQRDAQEATTFKQLADSIPDGQTTMLSPEQFKRLYLKLPVEIAREIASPFELIRAEHGGPAIREAFGQLLESGGFLGIPLIGLAVGDNLLQGLPGSGRLAPFFPDGPYFRSLVIGGRQVGTDGFFDPVKAELGNGQQNHQ